MHHGGSTEPSRQGALALPRGQAAPRDPSWLAGALRRCPPPRLSVAPVPPGGTGTRRRRDASKLHLSTPSRGTMLMRPTRSPRAAVAAMLAALVLLGGAGCAATTANPASSGGAASSRSPGLA